MEISTIGLDLAKSVFQVHAINEAGEVVVRNALHRAPSRLSTPAIARFLDVRSAFGGKQTFACYALHAIHELCGSSLLLL
jgi:hypothetical protein